MTYAEYKAKRKSLMEKLQTAIDTGADDKTYQAAYKAVNDLDSEWQKITDRQDNLRALSDDNPRMMNIGDMSVKDLTGYKLVSAADFGPVSAAIVHAPSGTPVFLGDNGSMLDFALEQNNVDTSYCRDPEALGNAVRGIVTGRWSSPELKNAVTTSGSSVIIPQVLSAQVIDLARSMSLFGAAGVPTVPMEGNNLTIARVKTDPVFKFKAEGQAASESSMELDSVELKARTAYGYAYVTLEALMSARNLSGILQQAFAAAMAQMIDTAFLYGQDNGEGGFDTFAPGGIMNDTDILSLVSDGGYADFIKAAGLIRKANGEPTIAAMNAHTDEALALLTDLQGRFLEPPVQFTQLQKIVSNQLVHDDVTGSDALVFDPSAMLIGVQNSLRIRIVDQGDEQLKKGLVAFQIYSMLDCKVVRPKAICKITGIQTDPTGATGATGES